MENAALAIIALLAGYYVYRKLFKSSGCNCGSKDCSSKRK